MDFLTVQIGRRVLAAIDYWLNLFTFAQTALLDWWRMRGFSNPAIRQALTTQIVFTGVYALPVILLLALMTAFGITLQALSFGSDLNRELSIPALLSHAIVYEIAPLLTAIIIISRSASAIVVDIGSMKVRGEIESLIQLGIDIDDYIVAPRLIAGAVSQVGLAIYFVVIALYGGTVLAGMLVDASHLASLNDLFHALPLSTLFWFVVKNICFGWLICATACYHALQVEDQITQLPQQVQRAIVRATAQVLLVNLVFVILV